MLRMAREPMSARFADWPAPARTVIERACHAYGGEERWRQLRLRLELRSLRGLVPALKGLRRTFPFPARALVEPARAAATFEDYPVPGARIHFEAGAVRLVGHDGQEQHSPDHRASFQGLGKWRRWSPLDAVYFFGYALTHYHAMPFTLSEARLLRHRGDVLTVELPASLHTHSQRQTIHFGPDGLIQRHDYVADIVGWWARGAHFWRDYVSVEGFPVARTRHVVARLGAFTTPLTALHAELVPLTGS
jgi:hypothetical protein